MALRRFPPPWTVEQIPGGYKVKDANGQSLQTEPGCVFDPRANTSCGSHRLEEVQRERTAFALLKRDTKGGSWLSRPGIG